MPHTIIPANPGFTAIFGVYRNGTHVGTRSAPVIAWFIEPVGPRVEIRPIGVDGLFPRDAQVTGPDGDSAHRRA